MNSAFFLKLQIWDGSRAFFSSALYPLIETIAMLVLLQNYDGSFYEKTILAMLLRSGLMVSLPMVSLCSKIRLGKNWIISGTLFLSSFALLNASSVSSSLVYLILICIAVIFPMSVLPIITENYSLFTKEQRGKRYVTSFIAMILGSLLFSYISNYFLKEEPLGHRLLFIIFSGSLFIAAFCSLNLPAAPTKSRNLSLKKIFLCLKNDKLFAYICFTWYLLGMANLWLLPYRTNFLVEEQFGFQYDATTVILLLVVVPEIAKGLSSPIFAYLFDRLNFIGLRIFLNFLFACYSGFLFMGTTYTHHLIGMTLFGLALGGGSIAWSLWVTRYAKTEDVPLYMAIHTSLTGLRAITGPILGLWMLENAGGDVCAWLSVGTILITMLLMLPILKYGRTRFSN